MKDESGTLATVISCERKVEEDGSHLVDVHVDSGAGVPEDLELYQPPGEDSLPMAGDSALLQEAPGTGIKAVVGFDDPVNEGKAAEGEKRLYSRTKAGALAADIWLKNDGSIHIEVHEITAPIYLKTKGPVIVDSPDIRLGDETASRQIACVGDIVAGSLKALCTAPGSPLLPAAGSPSPSGGVPFTAQIISGSAKAKSV
jgi:hypothetical protein